MIETKCHQDKGFWSSEAHETLLYVRAFLTQWAWLFPKQVMADLDKFIDQHSELSKKIS